MTGKNTRLISLRVLEDVTESGAYAGIALSNELDKNGRLNKTERAFITELTNGVLRNLTLLDYILARFSSVPISRMKPAVRSILRQAVYEILFMTTADYAACSCAVEAVKARGLGGLGGFVNGVLRNIIRKKDKLPLPDEKTEPLLYLSTVFSHPGWVVERWLGEYGYAFTKSLLEMNNVPPNVTVCANPLKAGMDELVKSLLSEGVSVRKQKLAPFALELESPGSLKRLKSFEKGLFHVQDAASQLAVSLLAPKKGDTVVDLCAAPGGKSFCAAYLMENTGKIFSMDIHPHKTRLINEGADRLGITVIEAYSRDAAKEDEPLIGKADCVIVDAPCSGLGVLRKKPDIRLNRRQEDIPALVALQRDILRVGAKYVKPGGSLLYCTCTLTAEENEENARWFSESFGFEAEGTKTLFPHIHNTDGFFICKFINRS